MTVPQPDVVMENGVTYWACTPEQEKRIVAELYAQSDTNLREGNLYYVVSNRWYSGWESYVGYEESSCGSSSELTLRPGPIDNSDIIEEASSERDPQVRRTLEERKDYVLVPQGVWEKLYECYGGGPALPRKMIEQGLYSKNYCVEVYPLCLRLTDSRDGSETFIIISKMASLSELYKKVCAMKGIRQVEARIWDYFNKEKNAILLAHNQSLEEANLNMDQDILLEVDGWDCGSGMDSTGNQFALVPIEPARSSMTIAGGPSLSNGDSSNPKFDLYQRSSTSANCADMGDGNDSKNTVRMGEKGGLAGLQNFGNTCFINSALQCLVHTPPIVEYFLQDYSDEINTENPLGMRGELALAFGELLRKLWSSGRTVIAPRVFKGKLSRFAPQFSGYNQHDSQELLAFLLDGLHEDLNRVKRKPYMEAKDSDGRPDEDVADESWRYHKARNDSIIVDVCQGQYKSTLVCPDCGKISITFDPFMYLSLPLPSTATRLMTLTVLSSDGKHLPMPYTITVPKHGICRDLSSALATACCLNNDERLLLAEVYDNKIYKYLDNPSQPVNTIKDDEHIVAYRIRKNGPAKVKLEILHGSPEKPSSEVIKGRDMKIFGTPFVTFINDTSLSGADVVATVCHLLSPLKRASSSFTIQIRKENGFASEGTDEISDDSSVMDTEPEGTPRRDPPFKLYITDDDGLNFRPIDADLIINASRVVRVLIEWTSREHELYEASYLKDLPEVYKMGFTTKKTRQEAISLFSCLEAFLAEEPLGPEDMWYCPSCKEHRQANKKLDLWKLPDTLVFHLKRFTYSRFLKNKIDTFVNFPVHDLDLSKYVKSKDGESYVYELFAISNHYGGLGGGHYTAYAKLIDENGWYHFDDGHVSPVSESEIRTAAAYVLFYQRVKRESAAAVAEV